MQFDPVALHTLTVVVRLGTLESAARELHVTPSAVSQRIRALERRVGRLVLLRTKPVTATPAGEVLLRLARQSELLEREAAAALLGRRAGPDGEGGDGPELPYAEVPLVVNADTLAVWLMPALAAVQREFRVTFELLREDEGHSTELLRRGQALGAVTSDPRPVQGCRVVRLGALRYLPVATPEFLERWLPRGPRAANLARAPVVNYDRKDTQQEEMLRRLTRSRLAPPSHFIPSSHEFARAVRLGLGWGMIPEQWIGAELADGTLVPIADRHGDVTMYWQHWALDSPLLEALTARVRAAAREGLR